MKVEEPDLRGTYSYADYVTWQWTEMSELIQGKIFNMSSAPNTVVHPVEQTVLVYVFKFERQI